MKGTMSTQIIARLPTHRDTQTTCRYWHRMTSEERFEPLSRAAYNDIGPPPQTSSDQANSRISSVMKSRKRLVAKMAPVSGVVISFVGP